MVENLYNAKDSSFIGIIVFNLIGYYLFLCTVHGNIKFGLRFFSLNFYPLVPGETFVNSFMANVMLLNLYMYSLTYYIIDLFR